MQTHLFEQPDQQLTSPAAGASLSALDRQRPLYVDRHYGPFDLDTVQHEDCLEAMRSLPDNSADIAIADPPYNLSKGGNWSWDNSVKLAGFGGNWSKAMADWDDLPLNEYFSFTIAWLSQLQRVVRPTGSIWVHGTYHNIGIINFALQVLSIEIINEVVWYKRNSFPNLSGRRLTASHETILWAHTGKRREYFFDYNVAKRMQCPEDGLKTAGKQMRTVWDIPNNKDKVELAFGKHPTQKPLRLLKRMLRLSAKPGQTLLVPFAGSGSECVAARDLGIRFLGFETDREFIALCERRLGLPQLKLDQSSTRSSVDRCYTKASQNAWSQPREAKCIPSLIKWSGSKRSQAKSIAALMPKYRRYIEPFLGGGAMMYLAGIPASIGGDIYEPLIALWKLIQADPHSVETYYRNEWENLQADLPGYFYRVRDRFNREPNPLDLNFLMRTCVNGIIRFNDKGAFNNSFHLSRRGMHPDRFQRVVEAWHKAIQGIRFVCQDYTLTVQEAQEGDFVYLDPPYAGTRQRYIQYLDLDQFFDVLGELTARNVKWALSFDGKRGNIDYSRNFPARLYKRHFFLKSGNSPVGKVLNGPIEPVQESLYLNY